MHCVIYSLSVMLYFLQGFEPCFFVNQALAYEMPMNNNSDLRQKVSKIVKWLQLSLQIFESSLFVNQALIIYICQIKF